MNVFIAVLLFLITVLFSNYAKSEHPITCSKQDEHRMDVYTARLILFGSIDRKYPTSNSEMRTFCNEQIEIQKWFKEFSGKCLNNLSKQVLNFFTYTNTKVFNDICKSPKRKREFMKLGACGNRAKNETVKCFQQLSLTIEPIQHYRDDKMKIPLLCCNYMVLRSCNMKAYEKYPRQCAESTIEGLGNILDKQVIDVMRLVCGDYADESDQCDKLVKLIPKSELKVVPRSPIWPLFNLLKSLPQ